MGGLNAFVDLRKLADWFANPSPLGLARPSLHIEKIVERLGVVCVPLLGRELCSPSEPRRDAARAALVQLATTNRSVRPRVIVELRVASLTSRRARARARVGRPGPEGSGLKLRASAAFRDFTDAAMALLGPRAVAGPDAVDGEWQTLFLTAPSLSIRGGTDEIQRNIVGEHVLGLAAEPRVDRDLPFDRLPKAGRDSR